MIRLRSLSVPALVATMLVVALAPGVRADGPASQPIPSAVSTLTDEESVFIHRRMPDFDGRPEAEREKIATNVKKLFKLSPEDRTKFLERLKRSNTAGPGAKAVVARLPGLRNVGSVATIDNVRKMHAIASAIVAAVPAPARDLVSESVTPLAITRAWRRKAVDALVAAPPTDAVPFASFQRASEFTARRDAVIAGGGPTAPEFDRRRYAELYLEERVSAARRNFERAMTGDVATVGPERNADAHVEALGRALTEAFPAATIAASAVAATLTSAAEQGRSGLEKFDRDARPAVVSPRDQELIQFVRVLEWSRPRRTGEVLAKVIELQLAILRELKVPDGELTPFQSGGDEAARGMVLARLNRRIASAEVGPHAGMFPRADRARDRRK